MPSDPRRSHRGECEVSTTQPRAGAFAGVPGSLIYQDDDLLIWNKPPDLPSTGRKLDDEDCLQFHLMRAHGSMVWAAHQLDADTSGVNVFTTSKSACARVQHRLQYPNGQKRYLAVIHGVADWDERRVVAPIGKVDERSLGVHPGGKPSQTHFRVLSCGPEHSLVEVKLVTGRTHQIRIHLQHMGLSLVGEYWYRDAPCREHTRQALHAWKVHFLDDLQPSGFTAPPPADLVELAERLGCAIPLDRTGRR